MGALLLAPIEIAFGFLWVAVMLYIYFCIARFIWTRLIRRWLLKELYNQSTQEGPVVRHY